MRPMDWVTGVLAGFVVMALALGASFLWVFLYSTAINPGQDEAFYQAYAQQASPIAAVVAGAIIILVISLIVARGKTLGRALSVAAVIAATYVVVDATLLTVLGAWPAIIPIAAASYVTKFVFSLGGAWLSARGRRATN